MKTLGDMGLRVRSPIAIAFLFAACLGAPAEQTRYHGLKINEQYEVMLEQQRGLLAIVLVGRESPPGGPIELNATDGTTDTAFRIDKREVLVEVKVEVLRSAPPNYLANPGLRYRLTILGETLEPDLAVIHEAADTEIRGLLVGELAAIGARAGGLYREALHYGSQLTLGVLKASGYLPAELPMTIEKSTVGRIRGLDQGLTRRSLPAGRSMNPLTSPPPATPFSRVDLAAPGENPDAPGFLGSLPNPSAPGAIPPAQVDTHTAEVAAP